MTGAYASPKLRDQFLAALDADDRALFTQLALGLTGCMNPLPGMTCDQLGLPIGSTYGSAARHVLLPDMVLCRVTASATPSNAAMLFDAPCRQGKPEQDALTARNDRSE